MSVPKVFVSSTYYDLKQYRNNIETFLKSLGYEPVMHERFQIPYTQTQPLEQDCFREIDNCDIVICIIGNHFGTQSSENDLSITMNELRTAIKNKKKVYVYISRDVYIENETYRKNKDSNQFVPAFADNITTHKFLAELQESSHNIVISPFDDTDEIINGLKMQFAGLFQNFLSREASLTDAKTIADLLEITDEIKNLINDFSEQKSDFFSKFDSTIFATNRTLYYLHYVLGFDKVSFYFNDLSGLRELLFALFFEEEETCSIFDNDLIFKRTINKSGVSFNQTLKISYTLFEDDETMKIIRNVKEVKDKIVMEENEDVVYDDDLPF